MAKLRRRAENPWRHEELSGFAGIPHNPLPARSGRSWRQRYAAVQYRTSQIAARLNCIDRVSSNRRPPSLARGGRPSFRVARATALQKEMAAGATTLPPSSLPLGSESPGACRTRRPARQTVASRTKASSQIFFFVRAAGLSILLLRRLTT